MWKYQNIENNRHSANNNKVHTTTHTVHTIKDIVHRIKDTQQHPTFLVQKGFESTFF